VASPVHSQTTRNDNCTYNSFQYWRVPLPELDLSLLEDAGDHSQAKDKDSSSEFWSVLDHYAYSGI
uniref:Putative WW-binding domain-containing protein n=1 Tax=Anabas testudineus TaxID=64144 RepID=A0A7N6A9G3_ANATE